MVTVMFLVADCDFIFVALDVDTFVVVEKIILITILIVIGFVIFVPVVVVVVVVLTIPYCHDDYFFHYETLIYTMFALTAERTLENAWSRFFGIFPFCTILSSKRKLRP